MADNQRKPASRKPASRKPASRKPAPRMSALKQVAGQAPSISVNGLSITEYRPQTIIQINGATAPETVQIALSAAGFNDGQFDSGRAYCHETTTVLWNGPGMWMLVCDNDNQDRDNQARDNRDREASNIVDALNTALRDTDATVTELSHSRTILAMQGKNLLDFLYSGCPIDLDKCPPDSCFSTQFGHFNIMLHLKDNQHANMYVYRSFGQALWEHCRHIIVAPQM